MKNNLKTEKLQNEVSSLGINFSLLESIVKILNIGLNDEFNYEHNDIVYLVVILKSLIEDSKSKLEVIDCELNL